MISLQYSKTPFVITKTDYLPYSFIEQVGITEVCLLVYICQICWKDTMNFLGLKRG